MRLDHVLALHGRMMFQAVGPRLDVQCESVPGVWVMDHRPFAEGAGVAAVAQTPLCAQSGACHAKAKMTD